MDEEDADDFMEEEDGDYSDDMQSEFMEIIVMDTAFVEAEPFKAEVSKPTEMIFIMFSFYRAKLTDIATQ